MLRARFRAVLGLSFLIAGGRHCLHAQTACSLRHPEPGAFLCFPNPAENPTDTNLPSLFHISAFAVAPGQLLITEYRVWIDGTVVLDERVAQPVRRLPLEMNLNARQTSGVHSLSIEFTNAGKTRVEGLRFHESSWIGFCRPVVSFPMRGCIPEKLRDPLSWSLTDREPPSDGKLFSVYRSSLGLFAQNLKALEADVSEAAAIDRSGNLFTASNVFGGIEIRRYTPDGSIKYVSLVRTCETGFLSVVSISVNDAGQMWIAGNRRGCEPDQSGGFVAHIDTKNGASTAPEYLVALGNAGNRIAGIRAAKNGAVYVTGSTESRSFPHAPSAEDHRAQGRERLGFIAMLNSSGVLTWSTLLASVVPAAIAIDDRENLYVTGKSATDLPCLLSDQCRAGTPLGRPPGGRESIFAARFSGPEHRLSYWTRFAGSGIDESRAVSVTPDRRWILIEGETNSREFPGLSERQKVEAARAFGVAIPLDSQVFDTAVVEMLAPDAQQVPIAAEPALDLFATIFARVYSRLQ